MSDTKTVDVLRVLDFQHEELVAAGKFSGEGCWYRDSEVAEVEADYAKARAAIAGLIERERVLRAALVDLKAQCEIARTLGATGTGYWEDAEDTIDAALLACESPSSYPTPSESVGNATSVEGGA